MPEGIVELGGSIEILPGKLMSAGVFPAPPDDVEVGEYVPPRAVEL